jgi:dTMP kinase
MFALDQSFSYTDSMQKVLPKFIAFEGVDGSGQTTQATLLAKRLEDDGYKVLLTKEPTNNLIGGIIRGALTHEWSPTNQTLQLLYAADRGHHLSREVVPAIEKGYIVITDRYFFSSVAFGSLDCDVEWLKQLNMHFPMPELAFYIDVPAQVAMNRIQNSRFGVELFEQQSKLEKVTRAYKQMLSEYECLHAFSGELTIEELHTSIYAKVAQTVLSQKCA